MKQLIAVAVLCAFIIGCAGTAQRKALNTIGSVEDASTTLVDGYYSLVIQGKLPTNDVPVVTRAYNSLQQSIKVSLDAVQNNTNALAPGNLVTEQMDLANLVNQIKGKK